jgi:hypothetical protein
MVFSVLGEIDDGHPTTTQFPLDPIAVRRGQLAVGAVGRPRSAAADSLVSYTIPFQEAMNFS